MAHEAVWRGTMPVLLARLEEHAVARLEDLDRAAPPLGSPDALEDVDRLAVRMGVPRGARAGREVHADSTRSGASRRRCDLVEEHRAGEPLARAAAGLEAVPGYLHAVLLVVTRPNSATPARSDGARPVAERRDAEPGERAPRAAVTKQRAVGLRDQLTACLTSDVIFFSSA